MAEPGRKFAQGSGSYRYGFNGKENDNDVKGEGNQQDYGMRIYDPRIGKFLSIDPLTADYAFYSPYQFASNNPVIAIDIDGLESSKNFNPSESIKIYAEAEVTKSTLTDRGGTAELGGKQIELKSGAILVPAVNPKTNNTLVGYNVFDANNPDRKLPVMQILPEALKFFIDRADNYMTGARIFYSNGEPSEGVKKQIAGGASGNWGLFCGGWRQENREFWTDPMKAIPTLLMIGEASLSAFKSKNLVDIKKNNYLSIKTIEVPVKNPGVLKYLNKAKAGGTWVKVYDAAILNNTKVEVHYFLHKQTGEFFDSKITRTNSWSSQFTKGKNKIK